jgi:L-alanine-DL-glutamate epimerase-like enolase superfamily enzyme
VTRIQELRATAVRIPLKVTTSFSTRAVKHREYLLVEMVGDDGSSGIGYTYAGTVGGAWLGQAVNELIAPLLVGRDASTVEENWDIVFRELLLLGRRGGLIRALSAVDIAAWDLLARTAGLPLWQLLGGSRTEIPAYASGGYYRPGDPVENVVREIERYKARGFVDFKIKVGGLPLTGDVERVRAARKAIGPVGRLALDANNAWGSAGEALRAIAAFAPFDIWWIEEPLMPDDIAGHAEVAHRSPIQVATGEIEATRWGFGELLRQRAAHILQTDACVVGGVSEWLKVAHAAGMFGIPLAPHWHANLHAQLGAAVTNCMTIEYFALEEDIYNFEALVSAPLVVEGGFVKLSENAGIGFDFDLERVARFRIALP